MLPRFLSLAVLILAIQPALDACTTFYVRAGDRLIFGRNYDFTAAARLTAGIVAHIAREGLPKGTLLNLNVPAGELAGVEVTRLGKRLYDDELKLVEEDSGGRRRYEIYGFELSFEDEPGTDLAAIARGRASLTPVHFDLTDHDGLEALRGWDLDRMLGP